MRVLANRSKQAPTRLPALLHVIVRKQASVVFASVVSVAYHRTTQHDTATHNASGASKADEENALQPLCDNRSCSANDSAYSYTFICSVVCLSVVCRSHSRTLLEPFDGSNGPRKNLFANCSQIISATLPPGECRQEAIPPFAKLP